MFSVRLGTWATKKEPSIDLEITSRLADRSGQDRNTPLGIEEVGGLDRTWGSEKSQACA